MTIVGLKNVLAFPHLLRVDHSEGIARREESGIPSSLSNKPHREVTVNLKEGTRRLALLLGAVGAIGGGFAS